MSGKAVGRTIFSNVILPTAGLVAVTLAMDTSKLKAETITRTIFTERTVEDILFPGDGRTQMMSLEDFRSCNPAFPGAELDTVVQAGTEVVQPLEGDACRNPSTQWVEYKGWIIPSDLACANAAENNVVCRLVPEGHEFDIDEDPRFQRYHYLAEFVHLGRATRNFAYPIAGNYLSIRAKYADI